MTPVLPHDRWHDAEGYVLCRKCWRSATDISKAADFDYAYYVGCRPWNKLALARDQAKRQFFDRKASERAERRTA